ncbi:DENN domain-containing protein 1B-like isoform X2 [Branchiostoma lanceolatum]|uniref:DENN domain-containing protein 1B-like isoform X2 n=1 Tax=Branchiostoma lanceolatum TaxID=7740 RepID=UPI0034566372
MASRLKENPDRTFECFVEVSAPSERNKDPEIAWKYPKDFQGLDGVLKMMPKFCFPLDIASTTPVSGQHFTFVLTDIDSKQRFGFCRHSPGTRSCLCILSYLPWFEIYYKLLNTLGELLLRKQRSDDVAYAVSLEQDISSILEAVYTHRVPDPDTLVNIHPRQPGLDFSFTCPDSSRLPSIPENRNLTEYYVAVEPIMMLHIFSSMLYERRILVTSSKLSTLTAIVHGASSLLYPLYWQHVYIPVIPPHLLDYCCAPMPFLIGVHSSLMEKVQSMAGLEDIVVFNADSNTLDTPFDDLQTLPHDVMSSLKSKLKKTGTMQGEGVAKAYLRAMVHLIGGYRDALRFKPGEEITFSEEAFISSRSNSSKEFLTNVIQGQLFKQFIDGRLDLLNSGQGFSDVFEEEINLVDYSKGSIKTYTAWLNSVKKEGGNILKGVRKKAKPAVKSMVSTGKDVAKLAREQAKSVKSKFKQSKETEDIFDARRQRASQPGLIIPNRADGRRSAPDSPEDESRRPISHHVRPRDVPPKPTPYHLRQSMAIKPTQELVRPRTTLSTRERDSGVEQLDQDGTLDGDLDDNGQLARHYDLLDLDDASTDRTSMSSSPGFQALNLDFMRDLEDVFASMRLGKEGSSGETTPVSEEPENEVDANLYGIPAARKPRPPIAIPKIKKKESGTSALSLPESSDAKSTSSPNTPGEFRRPPVPAKPASMHKSVSVPSGMSTQQLRKSRDMLVTEMWQESNNLGIAQSDTSSDSSVKSTVSVPEGGVRARPPRPPPPTMVQQQKPSNVANTESQSLINFDPYSDANVSKQGVNFTVGARPQPDPEKSATNTLLKEYGLDTYYTQSFVHQAATLPPSGYQNTASASSSFPLPQVEASSSVGSQASSWNHVPTWTQGQTQGQVLNSVKVLDPIRPGEKQDPFADLVSSTRADVAKKSAGSQVQQVKKMWETFE